MNLVFTAICTALPVFKLGCDANDKVYMNPVYIYMYLGELGGS